MYILTIVNDTEAQYETRVFADNIDTTKVIAQMTETVMSAIHNICGHLSDEACAQYIDQTLEGRYPEYEHQLTDKPVEELCADYFSSIQQSPKKVRDAITVWLIAEAHDLTLMTKLDGDIFREYYDNVGSMLFRAHIHWTVSIDGRVYYEVLFDALPDKDAIAGERIHVKLEYKNTYDTLD